MTNVKFAFPLLAAFFLMINSTKAQTSESPWMAGLSGIFLDYQGLLTGNPTQIRSFDPGISFGAHAYVTKWMNASLNSSFVPEATYPVGENQYISSSLIDVNTLVQFKSNGTFLPEDAFVAPYLTTGFGLNTASNNLRLYIPAGLGLKFQITPNFSFQFESLYKQRLGKEKFQHISHSIGFVFALPGQTPKRPVKPVEEEPQPKEELVAEAEGSIDTDNDGVADRDDLCPEVKGKALYLGCPEEEKTEIAAKPPVVDNQKETKTGTPSLTSSKNNGAVIIDNPNPNRITTPTPPPTAEMPAADRKYIEAAMANIYFEAASDQLTPESYPVLDTVALILNKYPQYDLQVLGHTDNTGDQNSNLVLSIKRAFKVKYYLVYEKNVRLSRITSDGYSSVAPVADNSTEAGRAKNRRVEFKLMKSNQNNVGYNQSN
ncbi:MAG: OmpA family protein [Bacteroidia bacterium]|nr:OmpA family protein [Bacteroidia bacterium]